MSVMAVFPTKGRIGREKFSSLIIEVYREEGKKMNISYTVRADNRALLLLVILSGRQVLKIMMIIAGFLNLL